MRSNNLMDGLYFFMLFVPFLLSMWMGIKSKKIVQQLILDRCGSQTLSSIIGVSVQVLLMIVGILTGYFLIRQI